MNGYQRVKAALEGRKPDTTPILLHNFLPAIKDAGINHSDYRESPQKIAETYIQAIEKYQYDGILVDLDTATLAGAVGVPVDLPVDQPGRCHEPLIEDLDEVADLKPVNIQDYRYVQHWCEAVSILKAHFKDEIFIRGNCDQAPFSLASMIRTPQEWMMDLMDEDEEDNIFALLEYCTDITSQFIRLMAASGADMVSNGDSPAGPDMISPEMYRRFALPYEKRVVAEAHKAGVHYALHICGNTNPILDIIGETGADALELDFKTDISRIHALYKDKTCFIGNIDPTGVLTQGSVNEVESATLNLLQTYSESSRFILNAGCAIPAEIPDENLHTMIKTARSF